MTHTLESLQTENHELRRQIEDLREALRMSALTAHSALKANFSFEHRGHFENCPSPSCHRARVLLGQEMPRE